MAREMPRRDELNPADAWDLSPLYASDEDWEAEFTSAQALPEQVAAYEGRLGTSDEVLAEALEVWFGANRQIERVWVYAHLRSDQDLSNSRYQALQDRARALYTRIAAAGAYIAPEILAIPDETMSAWLEGVRLAPYVVWLRDILRRKPHTLSAAEERLMSMVSEPLSAFGKVFSVLKNVDISARLPTVRDAEGGERRLSHGTFIELQESSVRDVRREAFGCYYAEFRGNRATVAAALDGAVKAHIFGARARNFGSAREAALFEDNVEPEVYDALISTVHDALPAFYRYVDLRRRLLGLDRLHVYDNYVSVVPEAAVHYGYDEAVNLVAAALAPLGDAYVEPARQGLLRGWVDRYENVGKRSGAYSSGCYDSPPYILLNYTGTLDAVFTMAHELGHSMHSHLSNRAQPYHLADYRILVAEVASTTNEALLNHRLLETTDDPRMRAYLIDRYLDAFRATLFRQTMFAEFERTIHAQVEAGDPLTVESLDASYYHLVKTYFGDAVAFDDEDAPIAWEWARVDHFFYNFYVYKYATGMASAIALAAAILGGEPGATDRYLRFLQSGSSKYPLDLLREAGVDLTTPEPVAAALAEFSRLVGVLEETLAGT